MLKYFFVSLLIFSFVIGQLVRLDIFGNFVPLLDVSVLLFIAYNILTKNFSLKKYFSQKYLLLFIGALILSNIANLSKYTKAESINGNLYLIRFIMYSLLIGIDFRNLVSKSDTRTKIINWISLIIALIGIFQFIFLPDLRFLQYQNWDDHLNRLTFPFLDPSFTGALLLIFVIYLILGGHIRKSSTTKIILLVELLAIFLTFSRAAWITTIIIVALTGLQTYKHFGKKTILAAAGAVMAGVFILLFLLNASFLSYGNKIARTETISSRLTNINKAISIWRVNPVFGVGFNNYKTYQIKNGYKIENGVENRGQASVENSFVFVLATSGIFGVICFFLWIADMINRSSRIGKYILFSILIGSLFNNIFFYPFILFIIFIISGNPRKVIYES